MQEPKNDETTAPEQIEELSSEPPRSEGESRGLRGSGLRYGEADEVPSWARGKTADEILKMTQELYNVVQRGGEPQRGYTPEPTQMQQPAGDGLPPVDPNLIYSDPASYHRQMEARQEAIIERRLASASQPFASSMGGLAKRQSMQDRKNVWDAYAPEIEAIMQSVPVANHGNVDLWNQAADIVAGRHVEDIARKRADEILRASSGDSGMLRTSEGGSAPVPGASRSPIQKLFDEDHPAVKPFIKDGISAKKVEEHAAKMGHTPEAYAELLQKRVKVPR